MTMVTYLISSGTVRKQVGKPEGVGRHRSVSPALCLAAPQTSTCSPTHTHRLCGHLLPFILPAWTSIATHTHPLGTAHFILNQTQLILASCSLRLLDTCGAWRSFRSLLQLLLDSRNQGNGERPKGILAFSPGSSPRPLLSHPFCKTASSRWFHLPSVSTAPFSFCRHIEQ